ncbi:hypothetical protein D3C81_869550 [compost metagenome]
MEGIRFPRGIENLPSVSVDDAQYVTGHVVADAQRRDSQAFDRRLVGPEHVQGNGPGEMAGHRLEHSFEVFVAQA